jgi:hypothetical protein
MTPSKNTFALKIVFAALCLVMLGLQLRSMSGWTEQRAVYDDICYLRQAHLFQRFWLAGFDTDISRDDDGYFRSKLKAIGFPGWNDRKDLPCHNFFPATGKLVIQYPPGPGMVLALFPAGHQVVPMFMVATIAVFGVALLAIFRTRTPGLILTAGLFGVLAIYIMVNPIKASYSMAPTAVVCALSGYLTARWLTSSRQDSQIAPLVALGLLLGFAVDLRLANLFLAAGYCFHLLFAFLISRKPRQFLQGAVFGFALIVGMIPLIISQTINTGSPFISTYSGAPDVQPLDFSLTAIKGYLGDYLQTALLVLAIAGTVLLWRAGDERVRRVAQLTALNLAINLGFFLTYPIATPYYTIPIALLSLWSLLFGAAAQETQPRSIGQGALSP